MQNSNPAYSKKLSSFKMIGATIMNDMQTRYWALHLIKSSQNHNDQTLKVIHASGLFAKLFTTCILFLITILGNTHFTILIAFVIVGITAVILEVIERKKIKNITLSILKNHFTDDELANYTLFHLTEKISQQFNTPSLVDLIAKNNIYVRITVILFLFATLYTSFLKLILWVLIITPASQVFFNEIARIKSKRNESLRSKAAEYLSGKL